MKTVLRYFSVMLLLIAFSAPASKVYATHAAGAEILYQWLSDSTYQVYYKFYRDCSGIAEPTTVTMCYNNSCNTTSGSVTLVKSTAVLNNGSEIGANLCSGVHTTCTQPSSSIPGYRFWWYVGTVTLPSRCNHWTFSVNQSARNNAITNLNSPGAQQLYTEATLDNLNAQGNTSPFFSVNPVPFVCSGLSATFNMGGFDINNDSLVYTMIQPINGSGCPPSSNPIAFASATPAFNLATNPLQTNNTFYLDPSTGSASFTPSVTQVAALALRVDEYRNGAKIGSVMRDMQVIVLTCSGPTPPAFTNPFSINGGVFSTSPVNNIVANANALLSFNIAASISPSTYKILMTSNNATVAPGSVFTSSPYYAANDTGSFAWIPSAGDTGYHLLTFTATDSCDGVYPFLVSSTYDLVIYINPPLDSNFCNSFAVGGSFDSSDVGRFIIGTDTFGSVYSHLANSSAIQSYTSHPDTVHLYADSTYGIREEGIIKGIHDANAKVTLFIDYNNNHQYDIPDERVWTAYATAFYNYVLDTFLTIPATVVTDSPIMMRLILNNDIGPSAASDSACGPYISGETEDFTVVFKSFATSVLNTNGHSDVRFYPNPSTGRFNIFFRSTNPVKELQVKVTNITGQSVFAKTYNDINKQLYAPIDISNMGKGLYLVETVADGARQVNKILIQ